MQPRSAVLVAASLTATKSSLLVPVPIGEVWIVKTILVYNLAPAVSVVSLLLRRPGVVAVFGWVEDVPAGEPVTHTAWLVVEGGDELEVDSSAGAANLWISGARLKSA